jgi:prolyl-tRNA editing enzyme YbaK/EbsC (Cys-tRNA(Pro) deacylase)
MIPAEVRKILEAHGLQALEFEPGSTPTAHTAARRIGVEVGQIAKSILLAWKDGKYRMVIIAGDRKLSNAKLKALFGVHASMARPEETFRVTGFLPGGVCPFFEKPAADMFIDKSLMAYRTIYPAAGTDSTGVPVTFEQLKRITGAVVCDVAQEPPAGTC